MSPSSTTTEQSITLQDGRRMGYAVFGDPAGRACLFVPGYSASRWLAGWTFPSALLHRHGVRLIAVDRPGYGLSTAHPGAGFPAWARDASALADRLGLDRLAVAGVSMGAGPALALAAARPDLVTSTTILSGMPPVGAGERWAPASRTDALYWRLARRAPWVLRKLCAAAAAMMATAARGDADRLIGRVERALPEADLQVFRELLGGENGESGENGEGGEGGDARAAFAADVRESSLQGGAAMADDLLRYLQPWGFEPADVPGPVRLWHGLDDPKVPVELARRLAARLPRCTPSFVPGGHFAAFAHRAEILGAISAG